MAKENVTAQAEEAVNTPEGSELSTEQASGPPAETDIGSVEAEAEAPAPSLEELTRELDDARTEATGRLEALLRVQADMENLRKRTAKDVENAHKFGLERLISELLPVKDSMELGVDAASDENVDAAKVHEGMELTLRMYTSALEKFGVEEVDPADEPFNPEFHQAMSMVEADAESGTVITVHQKGYLLNGRLLRPALVIVAK